MGIPGAVGKMRVESENVPVLTNTNADWGSSPTNAQNPSLLMLALLVTEVYGSIGLPPRAMMEESPAAGPHNLKRVIGGEPERRSLESTAPLSVICVRSKSRVAAAKPGERFVSPEESTRNTLSKNPPVWTCPMNATDPALFTETPGEMTWSPAPGAVATALGLVGAIV
jgi:hypothetical protein